MRHSSKLLLSAGLLVTYICISAPAYAQQAVIDSAEISATNSMNSSVTTAVNSANTDIVDALRLLSGQNSVNSQGIITALTNIASGQDSRNVVGMNENATYNAVNQASSGSSGCNMITGAIGAQNLEDMVSQYREQATQNDLDYYLGNSVNSASHGGQVQATKALISSYCQTQATAADVASGACPASNFQPTQPQPGGAGTTADSIPDAVNADIILNATNGVLSPTQLQDANEFMAFSSPAPLGPMPPDSANSANGREEFTDRLRSAAQLSSAYDTLNDLISREAPETSATNSSVETMSSTGTNSTQELSQWAQATAANTLGYIGTEVNGSYFPNGVSKDAYLELRANSWANGVNFLGNLNSESEPQAIKDLVMIEAFRAQQGWEQYHLMEEQNALLASILITLKTGNGYPAGQ